MSSISPRSPGIDHVGLGSDFDGVDNDLPEGLGDVSTYPALLAELMRRGWSDENIAKLAGGNVLRVMARSGEGRRGHGWSATCARQAIAEAAGSY